MLDDTSMLLSIYFRNCEMQPVIVVALQYKNLGHYVRFANNLSLRSCSSATDRSYGIKADYKIAISTMLTSIKLVSMSRYEYKALIIETLLTDLGRLEWRTVISSLTTSLPLCQLEFSLMTSSYTSNYSTNVKRISPPKNYKMQKTLRMQKCTQTELISELPYELHFLVLLSIDSIYLRIHVSHLGKVSPR